MSTEAPKERTLRIGIIGGGPGGLGAAIALSALPNVEVQLYEKARELRDLGAGIRVGLTGWRVLELLGAADGVKGHHREDVYHYNGLSGELVGSDGPSRVIPKYHAYRVRRTRLQKALMDQVPKGVINLNKRLDTVENLEKGGVRLSFKDGEERIVDLVVGADGIRSVVREHTYPNHRIRFTGQINWRVLFPLDLVKHIPNAIPVTSWWHGPHGHLYTSLVDDPTEAPEDGQMYEIIANNVVDPTLESANRESWGVPATNERVQAHFANYHADVREILGKVPEGLWREFAGFAGPRLERLCAWDKVALVGDASHPLSGAFGNGAAFALQDSWILARAIEYSWNSENPLAEALEIYDSIRTPYYKGMYAFLDSSKKRTQELKAKFPAADFDTALKSGLGILGGANELETGTANYIDVIWDTWVEKQKDGISAEKIVS